VPDFTGAKWTAAICTVFTMTWLDLWDTRNKDRHGAKSSQKSKKLHKQALPEIDCLYSYKNQVPQSVSWLHACGNGDRCMGATHAYIPIYMERWFLVLWPRVCCGVFRRVNFGFRLLGPGPHNEDQPVPVTLHHKVVRQSAY
jgi:hypothetical protein